jgi:hypothetical protein
VGENGKVRDQGSGEDYRKLSTLHAKLLGRLEMLTAQHKKEPAFPDA